MCSGPGAPWKAGKEHLTFSAWVDRYIVFCVIFEGGEQENHFCFLEGALKTRHTLVPSAAIPFLGSLSLSWQWIFRLLRCERLVRRWQASSHSAPAELGHISNFFGVD